MAGVLLASGFAELKPGVAITIESNVVTIKSPIDAVSANNNIVGRLYPLNRIAATSFDIQSENGTDSGLFCWFLYDSP